MGDVFEVDWWGCQLGKTPVKKIHVLKCKETEYFVMDDVVKAACDLTYSSVAGDDLGNVVKQGSLGRITTAPTGDVFEVDWWVRQLGKTTVKHFQVRKCKETEYFVTKDVVKAAFDLTYSSVAGDAAGQVVKQGSLGVLVSM